MTKRNYGIDLLKIIATFMIVYLHIVSAWGGVINIVPVGSVNFYLLKFIFTLTLPGVNIFAIISGYLLLNSKCNLTNVVMLWFNVATYTVLSLVSYIIFSPGTVTIREIACAFLPFSSKVNWYFSSYVVMFLFAPFICFAINNMNKRKLQVTLISIGVAFIVCSFPAFFKDPGCINNGYSALWLMYMCAIGAYIKKYGILNNKSKAFYLLGFIVSTFINFFLTVVLNYIGDKFNKPLLQDVFLNYNCIFTLSAAIFIVNFFKNITFNNEVTKKILKFVTSLTFSVFIIHTTRYYGYQKFWDLIHPIANMNPVLMLINFILFGLMIFVVCALIESIRSFIFKKLKVKQFVYNLEQKYILKEK